MMLVLVLGVAMPAAAATRVIRQSVIIVHGHSPSGSADCDRSDALIRQLRSVDAGHSPYRFAGELVPVGQ